MRRSCQFQKITFKCILLNGFLLWGLAGPAFAQYRPPAGGAPPRTGMTTTGRRGGCSGTEATTLTALAPRSYVGQTVAARPTFAWFVPGSEDVPVEFYLYESADHNGWRLIERRELQGTPGMMTFSLLESSVELTVGRRYLWQVALLCNPNYPSTALVAEAEVEAVTLPPSLATALSQASNPLEQANLYGAAGFWYDALAAAMAEDTPEARNLQLSLLNELVAAETIASEHSAQLKQIITVEEQHLR